MEGKLNEQEYSYYKRISQYIEKYGVESAVKMTDHAIENHFGIDDNTLIERLFHGEKATNDSSVFDISEKDLKKDIKDSFVAIMPKLARKLANPQIPYGKNIKIDGPALDHVIGHGFRSSDGKEYMAQSMSIVVQKTSDTLGFKPISIFPNIASFDAISTGRNIDDAYTKDRTYLYSTYIKCVNADANKTNLGFDDCLAAKYNPELVTKENVWPENIDLHVQNDTGNTALNIKMYGDRIRIGKIRTSYDIAYKSIPQFYKDIYPDQIRHVKNFIDMYRCVSEGVPLPKSYNPRPLYEIEQEKSEDLSY